MKRVYISGKITGEPMDQVIAKFAKAEYELGTKGYDPVTSGATIEKRLAEDLKFKFIES